MRHRLRDRFRRDRPTTGGRRPRRGRERGAVVVEAAIILPLVILVVFGLVEFGLVFKDELTVSNATGATARAGAAIPKQADYRDQMIDELDDRLTGVSVSANDKLVIYKADPASDSGLPVGAADQSQIWSACSGASADCTRYEYDGSAWVQNGPAEWTAAEQSACRDGTLDQMGVYLDVTHDYITGFLGTGSRRVTDRSVYSLEPLLPGACEATP